MRRARAFRPTLTLDDHSAQNKHSQYCLSRSSALSCLFALLLASFSAAEGNDPTLLKQIEFPTYQVVHDHDVMGRLTKEVVLDLAGGFISSRTYTYDIAGNVLSATDGNGHPTFYEYDIYNRITASVNAAGIRTAYTYDGRDNLLTLTDGEGNTTHFKYNGNSQVKEDTRPLGQKTTYAYNELRNLSVKIDAKGQRTEYGYDLAGRLTSTRFYAAGSSAPLKTLTFEYNPAGLLSAYNDGTTSAVYAYDNQGRKTGETVDYGSFSLSLGYTYDIMGNKKTMTYPDGTVYSFTYDQNDQLTGYQIPGQGMITFQYQWTRPSQVVYPGGVKRTAEYDAAMRTKRIQVADPGGNSLMDYRYSYDNADNIITKETGHGKYEYVYDQTYQLTQAISPAPNGTGFENRLESFAYDKVGNRLRKQADLIVTTATFNKNHEREASTDGTYEYDANGNLKKKSEGGKTTTYTYDVEDQLVKVEDTDGLSVAYQYDPFGQRLSKTVMTGSAATTTHFFYADEGLIAEAGTSGAIFKKYGYEPDSSWSTNPLWAAGDGAYHWFHNDTIGTPVLATLSNGAPSWSATHDAFGQFTIDAASTLESHLRLPGQYFDGETGGVYNANRYYDPASGRYLTTDPIGTGLAIRMMGAASAYRSGVVASVLSMGEIDGERSITKLSRLFSGSDANLYSYAINDPANLYDPSGAIVPVIGVAWLAIEAALSVKDGIDTIDTIRDPCKTTSEKFLMAGLFAAGVVGPGGGYGQAAKLGRKRVTVLGHLDEYEELAETMGANYLRVAKGKWNWDLQKKFIEDVIASGDDVLIASQIKPGPRVLKREIKRLVKAGFKPFRREGKLWLLK